jgi:hypothetical protein
MTLLTIYEVVPPPFVTQPPKIRNGKELKPTIIV